MNLLCWDIGGEEFSLGTYSFEFINSRDVFDEDSLDSDYNSEIIFELNAIGCKNVASKVLLAVEEHEKHKLRNDLRNKLKSFSDYLLRCTHVKAVIV